MNGVETEVLRANYLFRAVAVPAGESVAEFTFQPRSFARGQAISLAALGVVGGITLLGWFQILRKRHDEPAAPLVDAAPLDLS